MKREALPNQIQTLDTKEKLKNVGHININMYIANTENVRNKDKRQTDSKKVSIADKQLCFFIYTKFVQIGNRRK